MDLSYWPGLLEKFPDFRYLTDNANRFKVAALDFLFEVNAKRDHSFDSLQFKDMETLIVGSMYGLSPGDYLDFLEEMVTRMEASRNFSAEILVAAISPQHELTGLLIFNYKNPRVEQLLARVKELGSSQGGPSSSSDLLGRIVDGILSGRTAELSQRSRDRYPNQYPNNLPYPDLGEIAGSNEADQSKGNAELKGTKREKRKLETTEDRFSHFYLSLAFAFFIGIVMTFWFARRRKKS